MIKVLNYITKSLKTRLTQKVKSDFYLFSLEWKYAVFKQQERIYCQQTNELSL